MHAILALRSESTSGSICTELKGAFKEEHNIYRNGTAISYILIPNYIDTESMKTTTRASKLVVASTCQRKPCVFTCKPAILGSANARSCNVGKLRPTGNVTRAEDQMPIHDSATSTLVPEPFTRVAFNSASCFASRIYLLSPTLRAIRQYTAATLVGSSGRHSRCADRGTAKLVAQTSHIHDMDRLHAIEV